ETESTVVVANVGVGNATSPIGDGSAAGRAQLDAAPRASAPRARPRSPDLTPAHLGQRSRSLRASGATRGAAARRARPGARRDEQLHVEAGGGPRKRSSRGGAERNLRSREAENRRRERRGPRAARRGTPSKRAASVRAL